MDVCIMHKFPSSFLSLADKRMWIDLKKVGADAVWGDGTRYEDTDIATVAPLRNALWDRTAFTLPTTGPFQQRAQFHRYLPLCQANPHGIDW